MEVKQRGSAIGHKILLFIYHTFGYKFVAFILNFVVFYYLFFSPSTKKSLKSYYEHLDIKLTNYLFFKHIKLFALSILDRFITRIKPDELILVKNHQEFFFDLQKDGGIILFSHFGAWAVAANSLNDNDSTLHIVMREKTKEEINSVENSNLRTNEDGVKIINLNQGALAANIQIANAMINKEIVAMMADRVTDESKIIEVNFLNDRVNINKNPFDIAYRLKKPVVAMFVVNIGFKKYDVILKKVETKDKTLQEIAQNYMNMLEEMVRKNPKQWYNFYNFFERKGNNK